VQLVHEPDAVDRDRLDVADGGPLADGGVRVGLGRIVSDLGAGVGGVGELG